MRVRAFMSDGTGYISLTRHLLYGWIARLLGTIETEAVINQMTGCGILGRCIFAAELGKIGNASRLPSSTP